MFLILYSIKSMVVILRPAHLTIVFGLNIIKYVYKKIHACPFIVTNIIAKITVGNLAFHK